MGQNSSTIHSGQEYSWKKYEGRRRSLKLWRNSISQWYRSTSTIYSLLSWRETSTPMYFSFSRTSPWVTSYFKLSSFSWNPPCVTTQLFSSPSQRSIPLLFYSIHASYQPRSISESETRTAILRNCAGESIGGSNNTDMDVRRVLLCNTASLAERWKEIRFCDIQNGCQYFLFIRHAFLVHVDC